ncbi:MAG: hypothetical protein INQ03_19925 [Candidatus Heimdallarchaeota archaeon]|nr:hypothetical protein [Candidatus Heimdallarchaeota archaeon]
MDLFNLMGNNRVDFHQLFFLHLSKHDKKLWNDKLIRNSISYTLKEYIFHLKINSTVNIFITTLMIFSYYSIIENILINISIFLLITHILILYTRSSHKRNISSWINFVRCKNYGDRITYSSDNEPTIDSLLSLIQFSLSYLKKEDHKKYIKLQKDLILRNLLPEEDQRIIYLIERRNTPFIIKIIEIIVIITIIPAMILGLTISSIDLFRDSEIFQYFVSSIFFILCAISLVIFVFAFIILLVYSKIQNKQLIWDEFLIEKNIIYDPDFSNYNKFKENLHPETLMRIQDYVKKVYGASEFDILS